MVISAFGGLFSEWQLFIDHLTDMDVMDAPSVKLLVNGDELKAALGGIKPGMWMKPALNVCMEWQLRNPGSEDKVAAMNEVIMKRKELKIPDA